MNSIFLKGFILSFILFFNALNTFANEDGCNKLGDKCVWSDNVTSCDGVCVTDELEGDLYCSCN